MKKILIIIGVVVLLVILFYSVGWRLFGFTYCDNPQDVIVSYTEITENEYEISFLTSSSFLDYKGYKYKYEDGVLYVGARYGVSVFSAANGTGKTTLTLDDNFYKIVVKGSGEDREILIEENE